MTRGFGVCTGTMVIYKTTNKVNGKIYIGKNATDNPDYLGSGQYLKRAIKKYGRDNFVKEVIERCFDEASLDERERYWIAFYGSTNREVGYNLTDGGTGGDTNKHKTPEEKEAEHARLRAAAKAWRETEGAKEVMSNNAKRMWANPNHQEHMRKVMTGRKITWGAKMAEGQRRYYENHERKPVTEEAKLKISASSKGKADKHLTQEQEDRIVTLYQQIGPRRMERLFESEGLDISQYLIVRTLKKRGVYQKWRKGIGHKYRPAVKKPLDKSPQSAQTEEDATPRP